MITFPFTLFTLGDTVPPPAGALLAYEPFDYPAGTGNTYPANSLGFKNNFVSSDKDTILPSSLGFAPLITAARSLQKGNNPWWTDDTATLEFADTVRDRINLYGDAVSETFWLSFTTRTPDTLGNRSLSMIFHGWGDHYGIEVDSPTNEARVFVKSGGTYYYAAARTVLPDTTYFHLLRLAVDKATGKKVTLALWVYAQGTNALPNAESSLGTPHAQLAAMPLITDWGVHRLHIEYRTPATPNASLSPYIIDEIRLGESFSSVCPRI